MKNQPIDVMSISHFAVSFLIGYFHLFSFPVFVLLAILWEIVEYLFTQTRFSYTFQKYYPIPRHLWEEYLANKIIDMFVNILAYQLGWYLGIRTGGIRKKS